jgi:AAA domain
MTHHFLNIPEARVLVTRNFLLAREAVLDAVTHRAIVAIHGLAGLGKSFAIAEALAGVTVPVKKVVVLSRPTERFVVAALWEVLTGLETRASRPQIALRLLPILAEEPRLLIFEEAQNLTKTSFDDLRLLHDDDRTQFGLIFDGGNGAWEVINREPMLKSRLARAVRFAPLSQEDILKLIPTYHPIYEGVSPELLTAIDNEVTRGHMRSWAVFTHNALQLCERAGKARIDDAVVRHTILQLADLA